MGNDLDPQAPRFKALEERVDTLTGRTKADADMFQGRQISATAPVHGDVFVWNKNTRKWEPSSVAYIAAGAGTLDSAYDFGGAGAGRTININANLPVLLSAPAATDEVLDIRVSTDSFPRIEIRPDGILFGSGSGATDVSLSRIADNIVGVLASDSFSAATIIEASASGGVTIDGLLIQDKGITFPKVTTANIDANDEIVLPTATWVYVTCSAASDSLAGIGAGAEGRILFLTPAAGKDITLIHNGTVVAGKKLMIVGEANYLMDQDHDFVVAIYDATATVWNVLVPGSGGGAPTDADYLVGTAQAGLSAEIVVGATPGGELGGTWPAPTVDSVHGPEALAHHAAATAADAGHTIAGQAITSVAASITVAGHVELATAVEATAGTDTGRVPPISVLPPLFQNSKYVFAVSNTGTDAYAITLTPAPAAYATGQVFHFRADAGSTGAATLNVNSLGAKTIHKQHDQLLAVGDIEVGQVVTVVYDGQEFQMLSQLASAAAGGGAHTIMDTTNHTDTAATVTPVLGDIVHGNATPKWAKLAGQITTAKQFLSQTGTGAVSAVPAWSGLGRQLKVRLDDVTGDSAATVKGMTYWLATDSVSMKFQACAEAAVAGTRTILVYRTTSAGVGPTLLDTITILATGQGRIGALGSAVTINNGDLITFKLNDTRTDGARIEVTGLEQ